MFCTVQDSAQAVPQGYNDNAGVSLFGRGGKLKVSELFLSNVCYYKDIVIVISLYCWYIVGIIN